MANSYSTPDLGLLKTKLFQKSRSTHNFQDLTEEQIETIAIEAAKKRKSYGNISQRELYIRTLEYLTNINIHHQYKTFDERVLFLIYTLDPDLNLAKLSVELPIMTMSDTQKMRKIDKNKEKEEYQEYQEKKQQHDQALDTLRTYMLENIGSTHEEILTFERIFYHTHTLKKELATNIQSDQMTDFFEKAIVVRTYERFTDEEYQEAINLAQNYISVQADYQNPNTVAYNLLKQNKLIGGNGSFKQLYLLFILICDPELKAYKIYIEESQTKHYKKRMKEELGFYNEELIRLEKLYHKRFTPDKILSEWQI